VTDRCDLSVVLIDLDARSQADATALAAEDLSAGTPIADSERRRRFLAARREVRVLLGRITGQHPAEVRIVRGRNGKAELEGTPIHFSVSTRGATCAIATSGAHPVGVELAPVPARPPLPVLRQILPPQARLAVLAAEAADQPREFALWWCRVEAAVRACGAGLDEAVACLTAAPQDARVVEPDLVAAVAVVSRDSSLDVRWRIADSIGAIR
jgi:4'-phosphopantetheinyl transferase